jgi:hypothetical protein
MFAVSMKAYSLITALVLIFTISSLSPALARPRVEITPFGGYMWGGTASGWEGEIRIPGTGNWGVALNVDVLPETQLELCFSRQYSALEVRWYDYTLPREELFGLAVEYYQIGALQKLRGSGDYGPYTVLTIGATRFAPDSNKYGDEWLFSMALGFGVKVPVGQRFALRLQGRFLMPIQWAGGGLWCGTGGCGVGLSGGSSILQGDITAGLSVAF